MFEIRNKWKGPKGRVSLLKGPFIGHIYKGKEISSGRTKIGVLLSFDKKVSLVKVKEKEYQLNTSTLEIIINE